VSHLAEGPFDDPAAWQERDALLSSWQLDNFQANARLRRGVFGLRASVALVHKGHFNGLAGCLLNCLRQLRVTWARSCSSAAVTTKASICSKASATMWASLPLRRFAPSDPARSPLFGLDCSVRLSKMVALGCALRPICHPQHFPQVMHQRLEHHRFHPALGLLIHCVPRRQVVGQHPFSDAAPKHMVQGVEHLAQQIRVATRLPSLASDTAP